MSLELEPLAVQSVSSKPFTVTQLTASIKSRLEPGFLDVWVQGEMSNVKPASSGHLYFSLKDDASAVSAACFGWSRRAKFEVSDGLEVICHGRVTVYPPRGTYQLVVDAIEPLGLGALQLAFEQLKAKLQKEGLFDSSRKTSIPPYPQKIVIITSPSGAALQDMLTILKRRAPHIETVIVPALMQGDQASSQVIAGIKKANLEKLGDVLVVARGGGSIEDLWCFNDEHLARAIAESELPIISAIGHEIDFTISDFVADLRAPTPSASAEILTNHWALFRTEIKNIRSRLAVALSRTIEKRRVQFQNLKDRLVSPGDRLRDQSQKCDEWRLRMDRAIDRVLERAKNQLINQVGRLEALSPLEVLKRGYTLVKVSKDGKEKVLRSQADLQSGEPFQVVFHDGMRTARAD